MQITKTNGKTLDFQLNCFNFFYEQCQATIVKYGETSSLSTKHLQRVNFRPISRI